MVQFRCNVNPVRFQTETLPDFLAMLAALHPDGAETATSATGTSAGAALLSMANATAPQTRAVPPPQVAAELVAHAALWRAQPG